MSKKVWSDDITEGFSYANAWMRKMMIERSKLYGALIYLMIRNGITEFELPAQEVLKSYSENYYVVMMPNETNDSQLFQLREQPEQEEEETTDGE